MGRVVVFCAALATLLIAAGFYLRSEGYGHPTSADDDGGEAKAVLRDSTGKRVGSVKFSDDDDGVRVKVAVDEPLEGGPFHGFHVHANDDPSNGTGCVAPAFTSADGHFKETGQDHPAHNGDMPVLLENADGSEARFVTDRYSVADVIGRAVIVHLNADNYSNIPLARYQLLTGTPAPGAPPGSAADQATLNTGDAGGRVACGVITGD